MQRFGTTSVATHRVGLALLLGQWETAFNLILEVIDYLSVWNDGLIDWHVWLYFGTSDEMTACLPACLID